MFDYQEFNEKIRNVFSKEELKEVLEKAACYSEDVIYINLDCGAIEIAADGEDFEMFFMPNDDTSGRSISKKEVLEIVRKGKKVDLVCICVDE